MKIDYRIIDDLKTERTDVTPALPAYSRVVPILFYGAVSGGLVLSVFFFVLLRNATDSREYWKSETARHSAALAEMQSQREVVETQARRANAVVSWIQSSRNLQPLVISVIRSMDVGSSIAVLQLSRNPTTPSQIKLTLKLNTQGSSQLDTTLGKIASLDFRTYNPNQTQTRGEIDYEATLIYQSVRSPISLEPASITIK